VGWAGGAVGDGGGWGMTVGQGWIQPDSHKGCENSKENMRRWPGCICLNAKTLLAVQCIERSSETVQFCCSSMFSADFESEYQEIEMFCKTKPVLGFKVMKKQPFVVKCQTEVFQ
jgi:hypothetical protein